MHKKNLLALLFIVFLAFVNTLPNGFVGDDDALIVTNPYYRSWSNMKGFFSGRFITDQGDVFNEHPDRGSGSVAYRPVAVATFFLDYSLWKLNPFGYHLTSLGIHLLTAIALYFFLFELMQNSRLAFLSALIYSVHPIQTESVAAIAYRTGLLAMLFVLCALLFYLYANRPRGQAKSSYLSLSCFFYFLALFTKESAIVLPLLIMAYELSDRRQRYKYPINHLLVQLWPYILLTGFYLYIYLVQFPNSSLRYMQFLNGSLLNHVATMLEIFRAYVAAILWPFSVTTLPPLYCPPLGSLTLAHLALAGLLLLAGIITILKLISEKGPKLFFLLWFFIALLPTSNIISLANPMAYRFLNLPAAGLIPFMILSVHDFISDRKIISIMALRMLTAGYILFCMAQTILLNTAWKNNMIQAMNMARDHPEHPLPYLFMGIEFYRFGQTVRAEEMLNKGIARGLQDPRAFHYLGLIHQEDLEGSKLYFEQNIRQVPAFGYSYIGLGRYYLLTGDYPEAKPYLLTAVELVPNYRSFGYLIQYCLVTGQAEQARKVLEKSKEHVSPQQHARLQELLDGSLPMSLPVDLGL